MGRWNDETETMKWKNEKKWKNEATKMKKRRSEKIANNEPRRSVNCVVQLLVRTKYWKGRKIEIFKRWNDEKIKKNEGKERREKNKKKTGIQRITVTLNEIDFSCFNRIEIAVKSTPLAYILHPHPTLLDGKSVNFSNTLNLKPNSFTHLRLYVLECCKILLFSLVHVIMILCKTLQHWYVLNLPCVTPYTVAYWELL